MKANVILVDTDTNKNILLEKKLRKKYKTNPYALNIDLRKPSAINEGIKKVLTKYKKIDILINNVTFNPKNIPKKETKFENFPLELWQQYLDINLTSAFLCSKEIGKSMVKNGNGVILNISSIYGNVGVDQRIYGNSGHHTPIAYAVTKSAILNFTRYLAAYWAGKNIRVNTMTLGGVKNNQDKNFVKKYSEKTMLGRMATKKEYNSALLFLVSDASSYMTGSNIVIDGGWTAW